MWSSQSMYSNYSTSFQNLKFMEVFLEFKVYKKNREEFEQKVFGGEGESRVQQGKRDEGGERGDICGEERGRKGEEYSGV